MFPPRNILNLIHDENFAFTKGFNQHLVKIIGIFSLKPQKPVILKVDLKELIITQPVRHLHKQGRLAHSPQA